MTARHCPSSLRLDASPIRGRAPWVTAPWVTAPWVTAVWVTAVWAISISTLSWAGHPAQAVEHAPAKLPMATPESTGLARTSLERIDPLVRQGIEDGEMPGAVVLIGHRGSIVFQRAYGHRQLSPSPLPMAEETVFDVASITKPVATATSVMLLVEQGRIRLGDRVGEHLPEFASNGKAEVTIGQLLLHTGGMIPDNSLSDYEEGKAQALEKLLDLGLNYTPGAKFRYSDVGFMVLAEVVRRTTGKDVNEFSREAIFAPLGMTESGFLPPESHRARAAATEQRDNRWMTGEVHDPRAHALGGVAGHAGLFSTAADLAVYAQMMINGGQYGGVRILAPETVQTMTAAYPVPQGERGLGWDKRSAYSSNRGKTMTASAFGHGGFTGTVLWIDPELELFVVFLSSRLHPDGKGSVNRLAGEIASIAADAAAKAADEKRSPRDDPQPVLCGIDVLQRADFAPLHSRRVGLITNHTGTNRHAEATAQLLHAAPEVRLQTLFSPEHGFAGKLDQSEIANTTDPATGLQVFSLYGQDRKPSEESLQGIDTLVFDIQDIGTRFYTYISTMGGAMEVAAEHGIRFVVLDRPNPINGVAVAGPVLDDGQQSFVGYHTLPVRHGMTVGELAMMFQAERFPTLDLQVVRCEGWRRDTYYDATGLYWLNPSPNMRNLNQAMLYPGIGLLEYTNLSVGRGTDTPFERIGAPWIDGRQLASGLNRLDLPGVRFVPHHFTPEASKYADELCEGVQILITDRDGIEPLSVGFAIALALRRDYPDQWQFGPYSRLLNSAATFEAIDQLESLDHVLQVASKEMESFQKRREKYLLYAPPSL